MTNRLATYPVSTDPQPNIIRFYSELRHAWYSSDDLPSLPALELNQLEQEASAIKGSVEAQLEAHAHGEDGWRHKAQLKLKRTQAFASAIGRERGRRNSALKLASLRQQKGQSQTLAECQLNAFKRILASHMDKSTLDRIWGEAKRQGGSQYEAIRHAVDDLDIADGYF
jgi:hypothetical protein